MTSSYGARLPGSGYVTAAYRTDAPGLVVYPTVGILPVRGSIPKPTRCITGVRRLRKGTERLSYHIVDEETLTAEDLVVHQRRRLADLLARVRTDNAFYRAKLNGINFDPAEDSFDCLPFTTRAELQQDQADHPPYGSNLSCDPSQYTRLHQTSGSRGVPMRWLDTPQSWEWWNRCWGIIFRAADVRPADRFLIPFSFGPFIGFWGAFDSAIALGHFTLPGGGITTTARLRLLFDHAVTIVCCTPTYALRMAEVAEAEGLDLKASSVRGLIVAGEPGGNIPSTRAMIESRWGARVFDHCGMTEIGPWGFECVEAPGGVHVMETEFIAEVIDPKTGRGVPDGVRGELVLTNLGRMGSPLIRYRTGDLVSLTRGKCACGRWFARADGGILGRIDDMILIRGNNVYPSGVEQIIREFDEVAEFRLEVFESGSMTQLRIVLEPGCDGSEGLAERVKDLVRDRLHFAPEVTLAAPGSLPRFELKAKRLVRLDDESE